MPNMQGGRRRRTSHDGPVYGRYLQEENGSAQGDFGEDIEDEADAIFGAEIEGDFDEIGEHDEIEGDLDEIEGDLDVYGAVYDGQMAAPADTVVDMSKLEDGLFYPSWLKAGRYADVLITNLRDLAGEIRDAIQRNGFPMESAAQVDFLRSVVYGSIAPDLDDSEALMALQAAWELMDETEGFSADAEQLAVGSKTAVIMWYTKDVPRLLSILAPVPSEAQAWNEYALYLAGLDMAQTNVINDIRDRLMASSAIQVFAPKEVHVERPERRPQLGEYGDRPSFTPHARLMRSGPTERSPGSSTSSWSRPTRWAWRMGWPMGGLWPRFTSSADGSPMVAPEGLIKARRIVLDGVEVEGRLFGSQVGLELHLTHPQPSATRIEAHIEIDGKVFKVTSETVLECSLENNRPVRAVFSSLIVQAGTLPAIEVWSGDGGAIREVIKRIGDLVVFRDKRGNEHRSSEKAFGRWTKKYGALKAERKASKG